MAPEVFELPRSITGFGVDHPPHIVEQRHDAFVTWARALAASMQSPLRELPRSERLPSFDTVLVERADRWLLHNRFVPLVGVLAVPPEPGPSWAVAGDYVDIAIPQHAIGWGPRILSAATLNAQLQPTDLATFLPTAIAQADRYKPATIGNVVFNYWT